MEFVGKEGGRQELKCHKNQNQGSMQALDWNWRNYWTATERHIGLQLKELFHVELTVNCVVLFISELRDIIFKAECRRGGDKLHSNPPMSVSSLTAVVSIAAVLIP